MSEGESEGDVLQLKQMFQRFMLDQQEAVQQETIWKALQHQLDDMDAVNATDYTQVKEAIWRKYAINHETYWQRFGTT